VYAISEFPGEQIDSNSRVLGFGPGLTVIGIIFYFIIKNIPDCIESHLQNVFILHINALYESRYASITEERMNSLNELEG
jgi:hypothetical protein